MARSRISGNPRGAQPRAIAPPERLSPLVRLGRHRSHPRSPPPLQRVRGEAALKTAVAGVRWAHQPSLPGSSPAHSPLSRRPFWPRSPASSTASSTACGAPSCMARPVRLGPRRYRGGAGGPSAARTTAPGSCISGGQTWHPEEAGRARSQPFSPPPPGTSLRGGQPRQLARPPGLLRGWAPDTRPPGGSEQGRGASARPTPASLGDPASA